MPRSSEFRNEINKIENKEELIKKVEEYFLCNEQNSSKNKL